MKKVIGKLFGTTKRAVISLLCMVIVLAGFGAVAYAITVRDTNENGTDITMEEAREIALSDAGLTTETANFTEERIDYENGIKVYEFEFYYDNTEYDYEINAETGVIYSKSKEIHDMIVESSAAQPEVDEAQPEAETATSTAVDETTTAVAETTTVAENTTVTETSTAANSYISVDEAKNIAVSAAGLSISDVIFEKAKLDKEDGIRVYEIEFYQGRTEYEYVINATTGEILEYDIDYDD